MTISVVICTKDRPLQLVRCLASLRHQKAGEIIVVDGSVDGSAQRAIREGGNVVTYCRVSGGLSLARNVGIGRAKGEVVSFIDDDCIAQENWIKNVQNTFINNQDVGIVFGQVRPYRPEQHPELVSMSLATFRSPQIYRKPKLFGIGTGNNMSVRKLLFKKIGLFRPWLGVGSICPGAEEEEFTYRALCNDFLVLRDPKLVVFHDRFMTQEGRKRLIARYASGYFAFLVFYALSDDPRARKEFFRSIQGLIRRKRWSQVAYGMNGTFIGLWKWILERRFGLSA